MAAVEKDTITGDLINAILTRYPQHKRVLFYKLRYDGNQVLSDTEKGEINKFAKILLK